MIEATFQNVVDSPWTHLEPIRLGEAPSGLGTPDRYVIVKSDDEPLLRIDLYSEYHLPRFRQSLIVWQQNVIIGWGESLFMIDPLSGSLATVDLDGFFVGIHVADDFLIVMSDRQMMRINPDRTVAWTCANIAIDGIVIDSVHNNIIEGRSCMDPPDDWRWFRIRLDTGHNA